jgi:hypothetical protein
MTISTYGTLKTALLTFNWARNESMLPDYIQLTNAAINMNLRAPFMQTTADLTINSYRIAAPSDFQAAVRLWLDDSYDTPIAPQTPERIAYWKAYYTSGQRPLYYGVESETTGEYFVFAPDPGATTYTGKLAYVRRMANFSSDSDTNLVLTRYPNLYLYGALAEAARYSDDDARLAKYERLFFGAMEAINRQAISDAYAGGPLVPTADNVI